MTRRCSALAVVLAFAWAGGGCDNSGDGKTNTTATPAVATSRPAPKPSPARDAAVAWARAVASGDLEAARELSLGDEREMKGLEAYVAVGASESKLIAALKEKLGGEPSGGNLRQRAATWQTADEEVTADTVTLMDESVSDPLVVKKQADGKWKVELTNLGAGALIFAHQAAANEEVAAEVAAGKYKAAEEAWKAVAANAGARSGAMPGGGGGGGGGKGGGGKGAK